MIAYLTYTTGAPCPTLVIDARSLPREQSALLAALGLTRRWLAAAGGEQVLKFAVVEPSTQRGTDLDYRFIQALPDSPDSFDLRGSCGHSLLGAAVAGSDCGMLPGLASGRPIRVRVLNNGDRVTCEVERADQHTVMITARFRYSPPQAAGELLLAGEPMTMLDVPGLDLPGERVPVSLVSTGNPYVFVDAAVLGAPSVQALFAGRGRLLGRLVRIRAAAATLLGWPPSGPFPKVAAVLPGDQPGSIAVRAVSVPSWHPSLALTGSVCLAAASSIPHTVPWIAAGAGGRGDGVVHVRTPAGRWPVAVSLAAGTQPDGCGGQPRIAEVVVGHRTVTRYGALHIELPARLRPRSANLVPSPAKEDVTCQPLSA